MPQVLPLSPVHHWKSAVCLKVFDMSGPGASGPSGSFQDRLNRVAERRAPIEAARPQVDVLPDWKQNIRYPASLVGAFPKTE